MTLIYIYINYRPQGDGEMTGEPGFLGFLMELEKTMAMDDSLTGDDPAFLRLVRQEELILQVTETLTQALDDAGVTRAELAKRLGKSPGFVSQVLGGGRNLTLRTLADIASALSLRPVLTLSSGDETFISGSRAGGGFDGAGGPNVAERS